MERYYDILNKEEQTELSLIIKNGSWKFEGQSTSDNERKFWFMDLQHCQPFVTNFLYRIQELTKREVQIQQCYANGQTYGQDGSFHIDHTRDEKGMYTFLYYATYLSDLELDKFKGETEFKNEDHSVLIQPKYNSAVFFDQRTIHRGLAPSRDFNKLRVTIAFKLIDYNENEKWKTLFSKK